MSEVKKGVPEENIWQFHYRKGSGFFASHVRARSEALALAVAQRWCEKNGLLLAGRLDPMIVADESVLQEAVGPKPLGVDAEEAVKATTRS